MTRKRKVGGILILIGIGIVSIFYQFRETNGDIYFDMGPYYYIRFSFVIPLVIFIILVLIGVGLVIFPLFEKKIESIIKKADSIKAVLKKNIDLVILGIFGISAFVLVITILYPEADKIIQAELIVILVCLTWFYALQTYKLVRQEKATLEQQKALLEQEKLSLDEDKNKRVAVFGEKRIEKFLLPMLDRLKVLEESLNGMQFNMDNANEIRDMNKKFQDFDNFRFKNSYMATSSLTQKLLDFKDQVKESWITGGDIQNRGARESWRDNFLRKTRQAILSVNDEFRDIMMHLRRTYGYFSEGDNS